jgi:hypothetical protein
MTLPVVILAAALAADPPAEYPKTVLRNDQVALTVYLPDAKKGFYRGTRFDWAGVVGHVEAGGRKLFGPWKDTHDPTNNDDIVGPCEEFGTDRPLGYADAPVGGTFLKIGVGALVKPKEDGYQFFRNYEIRYPGEWQVTTGPREVEFRQELLARSGHGYRYVKRVALEDAQPRFVISHELTNSGTKDIDTDVYNHNFFNVDALPVGPGYAVQFGFNALADGPKDRFAEVVNLAGRQMTFKGRLDTGSIYSELKGLTGEPADHRFTLRHDSGAQVTVEGNTPLSRFRVWGVKTCLCPEPFVAIKLKPGDTKRWAVTYTVQAHAAVLR